MTSEPNSLFMYCAMSWRSLGQRCTVQWAYEVATARGKGRWQAEGPWYESTEMPWWSEDRKRDGWGGDEGWGMMVSKGVLGEEAEKSGKGREAGRRESNTVHRQQDCSSWTLATDLYILIGSQEPRTAISTFTQHPSSASSFNFGAFLSGCLKPLPRP